MDLISIFGFMELNFFFKNSKLLLKAIQMATELDPNLEVEKVEITTED